MDTNFALFADAIKNLPVKIGAPSFVWRANYSDNVKKLRAVFDEVQLMAFEDVISSPISKEEVKRLVQLKDKIQYSLHLPTHNKMTGGDPDMLSAIVATIESFKPTAPETYILHLDYGTSFNGQLTRERLGELFSRSGIRPERFAVENLDQSFQFVWDEIKETGISICADIGHLVRDGQDPIKFIDEYKNHISALHIHGVKDGRDHLSLDQIDAGLLRESLKVASTVKIKGSMVIENYSPDTLLQSLACLSTIF